MGRWGRWLGVGLVALAGCGCAARPFAADPLLRRGRGVWGDSRRPPAVRPPLEAPQPPPGPTIGAEPLDLPTGPV